ncbi:MAG: hypothetical protein O6929_04020 [candidate division NC10 bacterium]|nr:hypothetical protein [candidate division NC10 bacterium]
MTRRMKQLIGLAVCAGIVLAYIFLSTTDFITAAIAFAATFSGVYLSFSKENRRRREEERSEAARREAEEKEQFARLIQGVLVESANDHTILNNIRKMVAPGVIFVGEVSTDALQAALSDPLFHRWADHSLVLAATIVKSRLVEMNNILSEYRARGRMEFPGDVERMKIRAEKRQEVIKVMQELLEMAMTQYGAAIVADVRTQEINERLQRILQEERQQIERIEGGPLR